LLMGPLDELNGMLGHILFYLYNQQQHNDTTFENIKKGCEAIDQYLVKLNYNYNKIPTKVFGLDKHDVDVIRALTINKTPILEGIMYCLSPSRNQFKHVNINQINDLPGDREVWTDSICIFKKVIL
jgi:hypothetical protein